MSQLFFLLLLLGCPLMMVFMMRGMGGGRREITHDHSDGSSIDTAAHDVRIADLEREVARLRGVQRPTDAADPIVVEHLHGQPDKELAGRSR